MDNGESAYRRFLDGDEAAFSLVMEIYKNNLIFFINRYVRNLAIAEEISEDVFVELLIHKRRYNFKTPLKTYLFTIARNKAVSFVRKASRGKEYPYEFIESESTGTDIEDEFIKKEQFAQLHRALEKLNTDYRTVLHLIYFEDMSNGEAASVMKKNKKQIENLVYRAKAALKKEYEKEANCREKL